MRFELADVLALRLGLIDIILEVGPGNPRSHGHPKCRCKHSIAIIECILNTLLPARVALVDPWYTR
jgi:hypothetical protein